MTQPLYSRELLRWASALYRWPLRGDLDNGDAGSKAHLSAHLSAQMTAQPCGSQIRLALELDEDAIITSLGMECQSCAFGQASAAIMAHHLTGAKIDEAAMMQAVLEQLLTGYLSDAPKNKQANIQVDAQINAQARKLWPQFALLSAAAPHSARHPAIMLPYKALQSCLAKAG